MKLRLMNDPVLREPTKPVELSELDSVLESIPGMTKVMNDEEGTGLAANQVGISKRYFIMKSGDEVELIINPEILELGPLTSFQEGCLSIPGTSAETQRAQKLRLKFRNKFFDEVEHTFHGVEAVAVQHEVDHLDGKLYVDQLQPMRRLLTLDKHRKYIKMRGRRK